MPKKSTQKARSAAARRRDERLASLSVSRPADDLPENVTIIRDEDLENVEPVRRIKLTRRDLVRLLRVPRQLVSAYLRRREMRQDSVFSRFKGSGWCSEELAAFAAVGWAHSDDEVKMPLQGAGTIVEQCLQKICNAAGAQRAFFCVRESYLGRTQGAVLIDEAVDPEPTAEGAKVWVLDLTQLADEFEEAISSTPLRAPRATNSLVPIGDERRTIQREE